MFRNLFGNKKIDWSSKSRNDKYEALKNAIFKNNLPELKKLIDAGVDINTTDEYSDQNVLVYYIQNCNKLDFEPSELIRFFIESGIDINHKGNKRTEQISALHYAVLSKSLSSTIALVESGINIELQDKNGNTALWKGIMSYRGDSTAREILNYLLQKGASLDNDNHYGISPRKLITTISEGIQAGHNDQKWDLSDLLSY